MAGFFGSVQLSLIMCVLIRQSNLDLELEELEEGQIREMREEGLLRPVLIKPGEIESEAENESTPDQPRIDIPF